MKTVQKVAFLALAAAFFVVPWIVKEARDYAPGIAVLAGIVFSVFWGNPFREYTGRLIR